MNELQVFQNSEFGELGVLEVNGKSYFPATACAKKLGYKRPADAITMHCKGSVKYRVPTGGGEQRLKFIPEGDLYRLITHSKLPSAEKFEHWVFDEVLPSIRKTGGYGNQIEILIKMVEQMTNTTTAIMQATTSLIVVAEKLTGVAEQLEYRATNKELVLPPVSIELFPSAAKCKLETFPSEITTQVDEMLDDMIRQQALNFSMIARYCTMNGYAISSPSVKRYYQRHFSEA